jgi:Polymerase beta, Nucleotidyltransferase
VALSTNEVMTIVNRFIVECAKRHDVKGAYLFGSFAKGTAGQYSDIDLPRLALKGRIRQEISSCFISRVTAPRFGIGTAMRRFS